MDSNTLQLFIPGHPHGQGRPRATMRGRHAGVYKDSKSRGFENNVAAIAASKLPPDWLPIQNEIALELEFSLIRPKSVSVKKRPFPSVRPDIDNLVKSIKDAFNGIVWHDDCQIVKLSASKVYGDVPGVKVSVHW